MFQDGGSACLWLLFVFWEPVFRLAESGKVCYKPVFCTLAVVSRILGGDGF